MAKDSKVVYVITRLSIHDMAKAVCTNRKKTYNELMRLCNGATMLFTGNLDYEHKKVNLRNVQDLLTKISVDEYITVSNIDMNELYEIKKVHLI